MSVRETSKGVSLSAPSETSKVIHSKRHELWFSKVPVAVIRDRNLSPGAKIVYAELAAHQFKRNPNVGQRLIAANLGMSQMTVSRKIAELEQVGHLKRDSAAKGKRAEYILTSIIFDPAHIRTAHVWHSRPLGVCVKCRVYRHLYADEHCAFCRKAVKAESAACRAREVAA